MKIKVLLLFLLISPLVKSQVRYLDDEGVSDAINTSKLVVIDLYADWCKPCKLMEPIISSLTYEYSGSVKFYKLNIDYNNLDEQLGITSIPTFLLIRDGELVSVINGYTSQSEMEDEIEQYK